MRDWSNTKIPSSNKDAPRLSEQVKTIDLSDGKTHTYRCIGPMTIVPIVWVHIKKKDGGKTRIPKVSLKYDYKTGEIDDSKFCPYVEAFGDYRPQILTNVINREAQENKPAKAKPPTKKESKKEEWFGYTAFYKESNDGGAWTPVEVAIFPVSVARKIQAYKDVNKVKIKKNGSTIVKTFGPDHPKYGFDITVKYTKSNSPAEQYFVSKEDSAPLDEEELNYHLWKYNLEKALSEEDAKKDVKQLLKVAIGANSDSSDDDDDDEDRETLEKKKSKNKSFDDEDDFDDEEDEEDERPKKKKKKKSSWDDEDEPF